MSDAGVGGTPSAISGAIHGCAQESVAADAGVDEEHAAVVGQDEMRRADGAMSERRRLAVEVVEDLRRLAEPPLHGGRRQARIAPLGERAGQRCALDPVPDEDVPVAVEEVVANHRKRRMRHEREQRLARSRQLLAFRSRSDGLDAEPDQPPVLTVDRTEGLERGVAAQRLHRFIPSAEQSVVRTHRRSR